MSSPLVQANELHAWIRARECVVFDCRFDLQHPEAGRNSWLAGHIPGAVYAHLDDDLSSPAGPLTGRHPLPLPAAFAGFLGKSGWRPGLRTVAYDGGGGMIASRLWWLMKYFGLEGAGVLDGGLAAWKAAGLPLEAGEPKVQPCAAPALAPRPECVMGVAQLEQALAKGEVCLLDARSAVRFRGESEPLDPVAGHIPGARNFPCDLNLEGGRMRAPEQLRKAYRPFAGKDGAKTVVHMCGSGVTACLNLLAMELAGLDNSRLYVGSWSEWIRDPERPVELGTGD